MKKNMTKLLALLMAGSILISGCGSPNKQDEAVAESTEETSEESSNAEDGNLEDNQSEEEASPEEDISASELSDSASSPLESSSMPENIPSPNGTAASPSRPTQEELLAGGRRTLVGIIIDATKYSVSIQTPDGTSYYLTIPDTGVSGNLDYITIGQMATLTYVGSLEDTALLVDISDSDLVTDIYLEEYAFAIKIINAVKAMDLKALAELTNFPVFLDTGNYSGPIHTYGALEATDSEKVFSEALVNRIVNYNLFDLKYTDAGFILGGNGTPNITFDVDDDGILGIIGINSAPANNSTKN